MIDLNYYAKLSGRIALKRGKISKSIYHAETVESLTSELSEYINASEDTPSEHLPKYTEAQEELADILIVCLTELNRRNVDVELIIKYKTEFNLKRIP